MRIVKVGRVVLGIEPGRFGVRNRTQLAIDREEVGRRRRSLERANLEASVFRQNFGAVEREEQC